MSATKRDPAIIYHSAKRVRIRAGSRVGRMSDISLRVNANSASDPWIRDVCKRELERRKELEQ